MYVLEDKATLPPGSPDRLPLPVARVDAYAALDVTLHLLDG